jgi:hypothetical protein
MNNFNLRKFLTENKLTSNSRNEEAELNTTASANTLKGIIYQLLDDGHIQPETADDLLNAVSNSPSDDVYEADVKRSPDNRKPENLKLDPDYDKGGKYYSEDGAKAFRIQPFKQNDIEYTKNQAMKQGKHIVGLEGGELKKFISDYMAAWEADKGDTAPGKTFKEGTVDENIDSFSDVIQVVGIETVEDATKAIIKYEKEFNNGPVDVKQAKQLVADLRATDEDAHDKNITNLIVKAFNIKLKGIAE